MQESNSCSAVDRVPVRSSAAATATYFRGFYRASKATPWRCMTCAWDGNTADYGAVLDRLLEVVKHLPSGELLVTDRDPNQRRSPR